MKTITTTNAKKHEVKHKAALTIVCIESIVSVESIFAKAMESLAALGTKAF